MMNDNHSPSEWTYKPRWLSSWLEEATTAHRVVVLTGARQVGKSTLLQHTFPHWRYLSLDDFDVRAQAERDPQALWAGAPEIILDEVQKAPPLLEAIKIAADRRKTRFVLSGSANLLLMAKVSESLAGRAVYFTLSPMTWGELHGRPAPASLQHLLDGKLPHEGSVEPHDPAESIARGFMPPLLSLTAPHACTRWWEGYIVTYLERDLRQLARIEALADFQRVMVALALRSGQVLNQSEVARDTAVPQPTVHRYLNLLEASHLLERLPAYAVSRTKRLIKAPKIYWTDPALAAYLAGYYETESVRAAREYGALFETMVLHHLRVLGQMMTPRARLFWWRTVAGHEVDFIVEHGRRLVAVEVKLSAQPRYGDVEGLKLFLREYPHARCGVLVHTGPEIRRLDEKIIAVPWTFFAGQAIESSFM
jgi:predicted AAA+ superfamily ATPase